jgi:hypothetical protein
VILESFVDTINGLYTTRRGQVAGNRREKAREAGFGYQRWRRYTDTFDRIEHCLQRGYHLEAVALLDSLITDRLASRIGHLKRIEPAIGPLGPLCRVLVGNPGDPGDIGIEGDSEFREVVEEIRVWARRRNNAMHAVGKILRSDDPQVSFDDALSIHHQTAVDGVSLLQRFDLLDTAERARAGTIPASAPHAFFPEQRRTPAPRKTPTTAWGDEPEPVTGGLDTRKLRELLTMAVAELYRHDRELIDDGVREEALVFRIGHRLANWIEHSGGEIHVDVEYNRRHRKGQPAAPKEENGKLVIPDLVVHSRGGNRKNLLIVEARRSIPVDARRREDALNEKELRLRSFKTTYGYTDGAFLLLSAEPRWWWIGIDDGLTRIPFVDPSQDDDEDPPGL